MTLTVYVPSPDSHLWLDIDRGSGIVGEPDELNEDRIKIDFEGNRYGAVNIVTFADRVYHAADRHVVNYPTIARMWVDPSDLVEVGTFDYDTKTLTVTDQATLDTWSTP